MLLVATAAIVVSLFFLLVVTLDRPHIPLGVPGAGAVLVSVSVGILEGPRAGGIEAVISGVAFWLIVVRNTADGHVGSALFSTIMWTIAAVAAGILADRARRELMRREKGQARALEEAVAARDAVLRVLELAPTLQAGRSYGEVAHAVCEQAVRTLNADGAALLRFLGSELQLVAREPVGGLWDGKRRRRNLDFSALRSELRPGVPLLVTHPPGTSGAGPTSAPGLTLALGFSNTLLVPPAIAGDVEHLVALYWQKLEGLEDPGRLAVIQRFVDQAGLALERAEIDRLHRRFEASLLPRLPLIHPHLQIATGYVPGEKRLRLGGDFFDFVPLDGGVARFVIGDVSGHGPDAAALGAALRSTWRGLSLQGASLPATLTTMNRVVELERASLEVFATVLTGEITPDGREITLGDAGHPRPILVADGAVWEVEVLPGLPVGFNQAEEWPLVTLELPATWTMLFYTDGLIEGLARPGRRERFGAKRLLNGVKAVARQEWNEKSVAQLIHRAERANGGPLPDDVAVLAISRVGEPAPVSASAASDPLYLAGDRRL